MNLEKLKLAVLIAIHGYVESCHLQLNCEDKNVMVLGCSINQKAHVGTAIEGRGHFQFFF